MSFGKINSFIEIISVDTVTDSEGFPVKRDNVGSTSVPGLCAKPTIDIMCVVKDLKTVTKPLEGIGYMGKGELNLPLRMFFNKKTPNDVNLHVLKKNNGEIEWNLCFQNYLRKNKEARDLYAKVKLDLIDENQDGFNVIKNVKFTDYTTQKTDVIMKIAKIAGFNGYRFVIATGDNELRSYKKLLGLDKIDPENSNTFNLCLYKGIDITAAAMLEFYENFSKAKIKKINSLDEESKIVLTEKIHEWIEFKNATLEN
jgi:GrpB-like predicted nucleotidyltransferase (UPF0157 family)